MKTEEAWIQCDDSRLYCQLFIPDQTPAPALIICHGLNVKGSSGLRFYTRLAERASQNGFISILPDFQGVGKSTGEFDYGIGEQRNVTCVLDYLTSRLDAIPDTVFIVGHSLGGAVSIYAIQDEPRVRGLVLWSTPKNHNYNVMKFIRRTRGLLGVCLFYLFSYIDVVFDVSRLFKLEVYGVRLRPKYVRSKLMKLHESEAISKLADVPLLIVIGETDDIVGTDEAEEIFASAHGPKSLLVIPSADHVYRGHEEELISSTVEWIKQWV